MNYAEQWEALVNAGIDRLLKEGCDLLEVIPNDEMEGYEEQLAAIGMGLVEP